MDAKFCWHYISIWSIIYIAAYINQGKSMYTWVGFLQMFKSNVPRCEKTGLRGFRPGLTQTHNHTITEYG